MGQIVNRMKRKHLLLEPKQRRKTKYCESIPVKSYSTTTLNRKSVFELFMYLPYYSTSFIIGHSRWSGRSGNLSVTSTLEKPRITTAKLMFLICTNVNHTVTNSNTMYKTNQTSNILSCFIKKKVYLLYCNANSNWTSCGELQKLPEVSWNFRIASGSMAVTWMLNCTGAYQIGRLLQLSSYPSVR